MAKRRPFKKVKPGEPIPVTARQLESFMLEHNGKFNSRDYDKFRQHYCYILAFISFISIVFCKQTEESSVSIKN